jgi:hypothetical protein
MPIFKNWAQPRFLDPPLMLQDNREGLACNWRFVIFDIYSTKYTNSYSNILIEKLFCLILVLVAHLQVHAELIQSSAVRPSVGRLCVTLFLKKMQARPPGHVGGPLRGDARSS